MVQTDGMGTAGAELPAAFTKYSLRVKLSLVSNFCMQFLIAEASAMKTKKAGY
jgi:hypothetical protein